MNILTTQIFSRTSLAQTKHNILFWVGNSYRQKLWGQPHQKAQFRNFINAIFFRSWEHGLKTVDATHRVSQISYTPPPNPTLQMQFLFFFRNTEYNVDAHTHAHHHTHGLTQRLLRTGVTELQDWRSHHMCLAINGNVASHWKNRPL